MAVLGLTAVWSGPPERTQHRAPRARRGRRDACALPWARCRPCPPPWPSSAGSTLRSRSTPTAGRPRRPCRAPGQGRGRRVRGELRARRRAGAGCGWCPARARRGLQAAEVLRVSQRGAPSSRHRPSVAVSWLAHATLQSGVWVDNQWSYDRLLSGDRTSLTSVFGRAGWRTVALLPVGPGSVAAGQRLLRLRHGLRQLEPGVRRTRFRLLMMPDQYALRAFQRLELAPAGDRR